ncbi:uncharacterized protein LOC129285442 [Prosopis cineraria]|uniref:uncharacterized protein LOC129285442 n=1 Tax=Prosopis cineraria TaxID=364024 RepID=UPI0024102095|nr:uncharacterized protein LOC129285442 [Prosopis cineraria]
MCNKLRVVARRGREAEDSQRRDGRGYFSTYTSLTGGVGKRAGYSSGPSGLGSSSSKKRSFQRGSHLECHKVRHITWSYPENTLHPDQRSTIPSHVFAMTREEAETSLKLIGDIISLSNQQISSLFDYGVTHSFVSGECAKRLSFHVVEMPFIMNVSISASALVRTSQACLKVELKFGETVASIDLICLPMSRIDMIIGMDWLSANEVTLNCNRKTVSLPVYTKTTMNKEITLPVPIITSETPKFLLAVQVEKSVKEECQAFMVFCSIHKVYDGTLDKIGVVNEFPKVFTDEVSGLPSEREIEFSIDLVPNTKPISKAPY